MFDGAVGADAGGLELLYGASDGRYLALEARLETDERLLGTDGEGCNDHPFDDLVGVCSQQGAVLERARFSFGAVAHEVSAGG